MIFNAPLISALRGLRNALKFLRNDEGQSFEEYLEARGESVDLDSFDKYQEELWEKRSEKIKSGEMSREEAQFYYPETETKSLEIFLMSFCKKQK